MIWKVTWTIFGLKVLLCGFKKKTRISSFSRSCVDKKNLWPWEVWLGKNYCSRLFCCFFFFFPLPLHSLPPSQVELHKWFCVPEYFPHWFQNHTTVCSDAELCRYLQLSWKGQGKPSVMLSTLGLFFGCDQSRYRFSRWLPGMVFCVAVWSSGASAPNSCNTNHNKEQVPCTCPCGAGTPSPKSSMVVSEDSRGLPWTLVVQSRTWQGYSSSLYVNKMSFF